MILVPEIPEDERIESMCVRFDHGHGIKRCIPAMETDEEFKNRQEYNRRTMRQLYEEATGQGFYNLAPAKG